MLRYYLFNLCAKLVIFYVFAGEVTTTEFNITDQILDELKLVDNGYEGIVVAIQPGVPESEELITKLKILLSQTSAFLFVAATGKRAYFKQITILIPATWSESLVNESAGRESYVNAHIRITVDDPAVIPPEIPYTKMYEACGKPGKHIVLSRDYVINANSYKSKIGSPPFVMAHEWAHLRWGLLDEYGQNPAEYFYFSDSTKKMEATRCSLGIQGAMRTVKEGVFVKDGCDTDPATGLHVDCEFRPTATTGPASIMYYTLSNRIRTFCDDDTSPESVRHNKDAPTMQNKICGGKSGWEIIKTTPDFARGINQKTDSITTSRASKPTFRIVRDQEKYIVLILDVSGSMKLHGRLIKMRQAIDQYLKYVSNGSSVAIVKFSSKAKLCSPFAKITSDDARDRLRSTIPKHASGITSIGGGLELALKTLQDANVKTKGAHFILLTDGKENAAPFVKDVFGKVNSAGVIVSSLAIGELADPLLSVISAHTDGKYFYDKGTDKSTGSFDAFLELLKITDADEDRFIPVLTRTFSLNFDEKETIVFYVDEAIGRNTEVRIAFTISMSESKVRLADPTDTIIPCNLSMDFKVLVCGVKDAKVGKWILEVTGHTSQQTFTVSIVSERKSNSDPPIIVKSALSSTQTTIPAETVIFAEVTKGGKPVLGMAVTAVIDRPFENAIHLPLKDDGAGADLVAHDGIYSRTFTQVSGTGHYGVKVEVNTAESGKAVLKTVSNSARAPVTGILQHNGDILQSRNVYVLINGLVSRTTSPGAFDTRFPGITKAQRLSSIPNYKNDLPPSRIKDLMVIQTSAKDGVVTLAWTAPGDDLDYGRAKNYDLRVATTAVSLIQSPITATVIFNIDIIKGDLTSPKPAGELEVFVVKVKHIPENNSTFAFIIRTNDNDGYFSRFSNVAIVGLGYVPDINVKLITPYELAQHSNDHSIKDATATTVTTVRLDRLEEGLIKLPIWVLTLISLIPLVILTLIIVIIIVILKKNRRSHPIQVKPFTTVKSHEDIW